MSKTHFKKIRFNKTDSKLEYISEEYLFDFLTMVSAKSQLPIKNFLMFIQMGQADSVACSRDDTNYSFYARLNRDKISIILKQLGNETIEFDIKKDSIKKIIPSL